MGPWWTGKAQNKSFKVLERTLNFQNLINYRKQQAIVRREIRRTKGNTGDVTIVGMNSPLERVGNDPECQGTGMNMDLQ